MILMRNMLVPTLAAVLVCVTTFALGQWQTRRADMREALFAAADAANHFAPVDVNRLFASEGSIAPEQVLHRRVVLRGEWLGEATVYLDNRQYHEHPGVHVLTPLRLPEGRIVVVNRGWQAVNAQGRNRVEAPMIAAGIVEVAGHAVEKLGSYWSMGVEPTGALGGLWPNYSIKSHANVSGLALEPFVVMQTGDAGDGLVRDWPDAGAGSQQNRSYALQWFSLCALTLALWCWFTWRAVRVARSAS
jgi:surfeit locus 1 family protein